MREQAQIAIENATVIIFLTDIKTGLTASDQEVANMLLRSRKPIVLAVNKMDSVGAPNPDYYEFYNLGLGDPVAVSAVHGHGTGDLLDACVAYFPDEEEAEEESEIQRLLRAIGVDEALFQRLGEAAREKIRDTGVTVAAAVVQSVAESVIRALLFLLSFVVLLLLLKLLAKVLDLALKLPVLRSMNGLAGALAGLVEGALALFLAVWLLRRFGVSFETPAVEGTYLLSFFTSHTPLSALASVGTRG